MSDPTTTYPEPSVQECLAEDGTPTAEEDKDKVNAPQKFRKRPVTVEAMLFDGSPAEAIEVFYWVERHTLGSFEPLDVIEGRVPVPESGVSIDPSDGALLIATLEGVMKADPGDWIIRGVQGEFYPVKSDIFEATYERVDDDE